MNPILLMVSLLFSAAVAAAAYLTPRHRGPFAFVLARLRADAAAYAQVATMLWVVVIGIAAMPALAWLWPAETATWAVYYFVVAPGLVVALRSTRISRAP
jgi:hypothetical protein